jgi:hypothetical protein
MAQDLTVNIKTTSDVPQAMDKAKAAAGSFNKQVEDIGKKFQTSFKDIFLGFAAPMVLLQSAISYISGAIEKAKQDAREGLDLIAKGETKFATSQQKKQASFVKFKIAEQEEEQKVKAGAQKIYEEFLNTKEGKAIYDKYSAQFSGPEGEANIFTIPQMAESQKVRDEIEQWFRDNQDKLDVDAGEKGSKDTQFKGPEGFGSVIGVGANPVMEAMTRQTEVLEEIKAVLEEQNLMRKGGTVPAPFTETVPLPVQKAGSF